MAAVADGPAESDSSRPAPRYGEYATPEEVAAARGPLPDRLEAPRIVEPARVAPGRAPSGVGRDASARVRPPSRANNLITTLLLIFGVWNTLGSIPSYLDFDVALTQGFATFGYGTVSFGPVAHTAGVVLLVISVLVMVAAIGLSFRLMRDRRRSIWVPLAAGAVSILASIVVATVIVANTPGLAAVLHNH